MTPVLGRRHFMGGALAAGALAGARARAMTPALPLAALEGRSGGRLGVVALRFRPGQKGKPVADRYGRIVWSRSVSDDYDWICGHRGDERFAFCSSFKLSLAALVLHGADKGEWRLDERIAYAQADLLPNSPVTQAHLGQGAMAMVALAEAAQKFSDNAATNLLLRRMGGFDRLNQFWWSMGDTASRLDDYETGLNRVPLGSVRNTTTPQAMALNLLKLFHQGALSPANAATLKGWMHDTTTGAKRLRAGLPVDWWAGDKTGTGLPSDIRGTYVDLAWVEPPKLPPFAIAAFYQPPAPTPDGDSHAEEVLAQVGRIVAQAIVLQGK